MFDEEVGQRLALWLPKGAWLKKFSPKFCLLRLILKRVRNRSQHPILPLGNFGNIPDTWIFKSGKHVQPFGIEGEKYLLTR